MWLRLLGCLLLVAAGLKIHGLALDTVAPIGPFSSLPIQSAVAAFELVLGLWLVSGVRASAARLAAICVFATFAAVSLHQGWIGEATCGCFGRFSIGPWHAFTIDVLAVGLLSAIGPEAPKIETSAPSGLSWIGAAAIVSVAFLAVSYIGFGSPDDAIAYFRAERVSVRPGVLDLGADVTGANREAKVELINRTDQPVRIIGAASECSAVSCIVVEPLPLVVAPRSTRRVSMQVRFSHHPGFFTRTLRLFADADGLRLLQVRVAGRSFAEDERSPVFK